jgi:hypothetical protein
MRMRIFSGVAALFTVAGGANAQINIYPNPSPNPFQRPAFAPQPGTPRPAADAPLPAPNLSTTANAPQAKGPLGWYPFPNDGVQQAKVDGTPPPAPAPQMPAQQFMPQPVVGQDCPDATAPYMRDVAESCNDGCTSTLCGPPGRVWFGAEYLRWTTSGNALPPLLTTAPVGTPRAQAGTLGDPRTTVLLGGNNANNDWRNGLRIYGGLWLNEEQTCGLEMGWFFLANSNNSATIGSNGSQILTRPFTNNVQADALGTFTAVAPFQDTELVSFPGVLAGSTTVESSSVFWGLDPSIVKNLCCSPCARLDVLFGYRLLYLEDSLTITENLTGLAGSDFPGVQFTVTDSFRTKNYFNGVNGGFKYERRFDRFFLGAHATVALGVTTSTTDINGSTVVRDVNGTTTTYQGGLLALPSNIGSYTSNAFSVVPEVGLKAGMQVTDHLRIFAGYNYMYWSNVMRTGGVIDTRVNASQLPPSDGVVGAAYPRYEPSRTGFSAHGVSFGLELRY